MKRVLSFVLILVFFVAGCSRQSNTPPTMQPPEGQNPVLPAERQISLRKVSYQRRDLLAVFRDFTGVTDLTLSSSGLSYIQDKALWNSDLSGQHVLMHQEPAANYEKWYVEISTLHEGQRQSVVEREYLLAYNEASNLVLAHASGDERFLVRDAGELEILGWMDPTILVFYADLPGHGKNVYALDVWDELVAFNSQYTNTLSIENFTVSDVVRGLTGHMWFYDEDRIAYVLDGKIYTVDSSGVSRLVATPDNATLLRANRNAMVFQTQGGSTAPILLYNGRTTTLSHFTGPMEIDWLNEKLYYVFQEGMDSGISVINLDTREETILLIAAENMQVTSFALSPDRDEFIFIQSREIIPADGPYSDYINEVYRLDMISGHMQLIEGQGLHGRPMHYKLASAHWLRDDLLGIGRRYDGSPLGEAPLGLYHLTATGGGISVAEQWEQHVELISQDSNHIFLADWNSGDGWSTSFHFNVWHYDTALGARPRQLTKASSWQIQQDKALAYNAERGLLFISRLKGFEDQGYDYKKPIVHGVLVDLQGREYTLFSEDISSIDQAVWVGEHLYVQLPGKIVRVTVK